MHWLRPPANGKRRLATHRRNRSKRRHQCCGVVPALGSSDPDVDSPAAADDGAASSMLCGPNTNAEGASFCKASLNVLPPALASMSEYVALPTLARMSAATTDVRALEPRRSTSWRVSFTSSGSESEGLVVTAAAAAAAGSPEG